jgi:hypothetical protein
MVNEDWLEFMSRRGEALVQRLASRLRLPRLPLPAAARCYLGTNLYLLHALLQAVRGQA